MKALTLALGVAAFGFAGTASAGQPRAYGHNHGDYGYNHGNHNHGGFSNNWGHQHGGWDHNHHHHGYYAPSRPYAYPAYPAYGYPAYGYPRPGVAFGFTFSR